MLFHDQNPRVKDIAYDGKAIGSEASAGMYYSGNQGCYSAFASQELVVLNLISTFKAEMVRNGTVFEVNKE